MVPDRNLVTAQPQSALPTTDPSSAPSVCSAAAVDAPEIPGYQITVRLGAGGMGVVWRAEQLTTHRQVALKLLSTSIFSSDRARARFDREVELTASLEHPHIARLYDSGTHRGVFFYAMELLEGGQPLDEYVRRNGLPRRRIIELCRTISQAVQFAHQRMVIHRDLKPGNILIDASGEPRVLDFGLAKSLLERPDSTAAITIDGELAGTPAYMSPEQAACKPLDSRTDVYSLGVILFELLIGHRPHDLSGPQMQVLQRIAHEEVRRPRALDPTIDRELEALLLKALAREPEQRYSSAGELARDLDNYLRGEPLLARPPTTLYFLRKRLRKHRIPLAIAAGVLLMLASIAVYSGLRIARERNTAIANERVAQEQKLLAEQRRLQSEQRLEKGLLAAGKALVQSDAAKAREHYAEAIAVARILGTSELAANIGLVESYTVSAPELLKWEPSSHAINTTAFMPDSKRILSGGGDGTMRMWDIGMGREEYALQVGGVAIRDIAVSHDGRRALVACADGMVRLWDLDGRSLKRTLRGHVGVVHTVAFTRDGLGAVSGAEDATVKVWDLERGQAVHTLRGHRGTVYSIDVSPDGRTVISSSEIGGMKLWDLASGIEIRSLNAADETSVESVRFSPDGRTVVAAGFDTVFKLWSVETGEALLAFHGHSSGARRVDFSPDGRFVVSASADRRVKLWDVATGTALRTFCGHAAVLGGVNFSPDGTTVVSVDIDGAIKVWDVSRSIEPLVFEGKIERVMRISASADGRIALSGGFPDTLALSDVATGKSLRTWTPGHGRVWAVALSPDGASALSAGDDKTIRLWDVASGSERRAFTGHTDIVTGVAISPDGRTAVSCSSDGLIKCWDLVSGRELRTLRGHTGRARNVAFSGDGRRLASSGFDGKVIVWDIATAQPIHILSGHAFRVHSIAFANDGSQVLSGSYDQTARLWDAKAGRQVGHFSMSSLVYGVAFRPDGRTAVSGGGDGVLRVWDLAAQAAVGDLVAHDGLLTSVTALDADVVLTGGRDGLVKRWDFNRAALYRTLVDALPTARAALARNPDDATALAAFGRWYAFRGKHDWAVDFLEKARAADAHVSSLELARCYWQMGDGSNARRCFMDALEASEAPVEYLRLCIDGVEQRVSPATSTATTEPSFDTLPPRQ